LNHHFAYRIKPLSGEKFQASDDQVELQTKINPDPTDGDH